MASHARDIRYRCPHHKLYITYEELKNNKIIKYIHYHYSPGFWNELPLHSQRLRLFQDIHNSPCVGLPSASPKHVTPTLHEITCPVCLTIMMFQKKNPSLSDTAKRVYAFSIDIEDLDNLIQNGLRDI